MRRLIDYFAGRSFIVNLLVIFVCVVGYLAMTSMNRSLVPSWEQRQTVVNVLLPGASSQEMERLVTYPIEIALKDLPGVEKITSSSGAGYSRIRLYFEDSYEDLDKVTENARARVEGLRNRLPESVRSITVKRIKKETEILMYISIEGADDFNFEHRRRIKKLSKKIENIKGISFAADHMREQEIVIHLDPEKLNFYGLSTSDVRGKISRYRAYAPIGQITQDEDVYNIEVSNSVASIEELSKIPISSNRSGYIVRLQDLGKVNYDLSQRSFLMRVNGKRAVLMRVEKGSSADTIDLGKEVKEVVNRFNKKYSTLKAEIMFDLPFFLEKQLESLKVNGFLGLLFVFAMMLLFFDWRAALMTIIGLPVVYLGTFIVLAYLGIPINLIFIVGMLLILGILVDDAIIVSEKYMANLESGLEPKEAAVKAAQALIMPVTGTVLTTVVAFSPLLLVKSSFSNVFFALPVVVIVALSLSWIEAFFILPNHLQHIVKKNKNKKIDVFKKLRQKYEQILKVFFKYRYITLLASLVFIVISGYVALNKVEHQFNLQIGLERVDVTVILKSSGSFEETEKKLKPLSDYLNKMGSRQVDAVQTKIGSMWYQGKQLKGDRYARFSIYIDKEAKYPGEVKKTLEKRIQSGVKKFKTDDFEELNVRGLREGDEKRKLQLVSISVRGAEDIDFTDIEKVIIAHALKTKGVKEAAMNEEMYEVSWRFHPNHQALQQYGLTPATLAHQIRGFFTKNFLSEIRLHGEPLNLYTKIITEENIKFENLKSFHVVSSRGVKVPLPFLGKWVSGRSLKEIFHKDGLRNLTLDFKLDQKEGNASLVIDRLKKALIPVQKKFPTYEIEVSEADNQAKEGKAWGLKIAIICLGGVLLILSLVLGSLSQPFLVGLPIPFGLAGIIWALYLHGLPLSVMAIVGVVGVIGVAVNDSLIMVDGINKLCQGRGVKMSRSLLIDGASQRLRAIVLTTMTTLGGVLPMAYSWGGESGFTQPLAFSIGWGLLFSTLMTLFVLPPLLEIREDILSLGRGLLFRGKNQKSHQN